jgi:hypothetical protein
MKSTIKKNTSSKGLLKNRAIFIESSEDGTNILFSIERSFALLHHRHWQVLVVSFHYDRSDNVVY